MSCPLTNYDNKHTDENPMLMENVVSDKIRNISTSKNTTTICVIKSNSGVSEISQFADKNLLCSSLYKLNASNYHWDAVSKSKSLRIRCHINNLQIAALIDSGAEINVLDADIARQASIGIVKTYEIAQAASKLPLDICGQTSTPVNLQCITAEGIK